MRRYQLRLLPIPVIILPVPSLGSLRREHSLRGTDYRILPSVHRYEEHMVNAGIPVQDGFKDPRHHHRPSLLLYRIILHELIEVIIPGDPVFIQIIRIVHHILVHTLHPSADRQRGPVHIRQQILLDGFRIRIVDRDPHHQQRQDPDQYQHDYGLDKQADKRPLFPFSVSHSSSPNIWSAHHSMIHPAALPPSPHEWYSLPENTRYSPYPA